MKKFKHGEFYGRNDFSLQRVKMCSFLVQFELSKTMKGEEALLAVMFDKEHDEFLEKAHNVILLFLYGFAFTLNNIIIIIRRQFHMFQ